MIPSEAIAAGIGTTHVNVADRLAAVARAIPDAIAVACAHRRAYNTITFAELDQRASHLARGLMELGIGPGKRIALLVHPGIDFVALVFALLRTGATLVLIDAGMGRRHLIDCLAEVEPDGFIAIPMAHMIRCFYRRRFPKAHINVTVGRCWFWGGVTVEEVLKHGGNSTASFPKTSADDPAAIVFTSGSTGPPKGVLYNHQTFVTQVEEIQSMYGIEPGRIDLACFPLFGLFNSAMGVTTVFPSMDFSRPASSNPKKLIAAANDWRVTQAFASPAVWDKLSRYCLDHGIRIPWLRRVFSCGAPVPADVLRRTLACIHPAAEMHTPYGATEALPIATISAAEVLAETAAETERGAGVCVGRKFDSIQWRVIRISDDPIATINESEELSTGEIGELIIRGLQVSPRYVTRIQSNAVAKITDTATQSAIPQWHRTGDVGYFDDQDRFWYCGRKSHRVETADGTLFTECVEAVFNTHPKVRRAALVGIGTEDTQVPVIVFEHDFGWFFEWDIGFFLWMTECDEQLFKVAQQHPHTRNIRQFLPHKHLPVDVRHNSKINREQLAAWAAKKMKIHSSLTPDP